jgi:phosphonatase-like hydrolase
MKVELVVFDMAGTTVYDDDSVNVCLRDALADVGVHVDREAVNRVMGEPKPVALAKLLSRAGSQSLDPHGPLVEAVHANFERRMLWYYKNGTTVRAVDDAAEVFAALKGHGVKVALDTGFNRVIADAILERLGWSTNGTLIDAVVASDEVERGRPHPDLIERAMLLMRVPNASAVAKVGDTPADLLEGTAAGCGLVIGITSGSHARNALSIHPHTHLIERLSEVPPICM